MNREFDTFYALLGLDPRADLKAVRTAYRKHVRAWHPDRFYDQPDKLSRAEEQTKRINQAYDALVAYHKRHGHLPLDPPPTPKPFAVPRYVDATASDTAPTSLASGITPLLRMVRTRPGLWGIGGALIVAFGLSSLTDHNTAPYPELPPTTITPLPATTMAPITAPNVTFSVGSTPGEVYAAQGIPTLTEATVWHYGSSKIYFASGRVVRWDETPEHPLRVQLRADSPATQPALHFVKGSSKSEVRRIQGEPTQETDRTWDYGTSRVYFESDRVVGWHQTPLNPLKAK